MSETDIADIGLPRNPAVIELAPAERRKLRARAHHLHPVVSIGQHGLTPQVLHEIDVALTAHGLIKVRVFNDDRAGREALLGGICAELACAPVQHLGKLLILWRPLPEKRPAPGRPSKSAGPARSRPRATSAGRAHTPAAKAGKRNAAVSGRSAQELAGSVKPKVPRRARGQALVEPRTPQRARRSPKAASAGPAAATPPRSQRRAVKPATATGAGSGKTRHAAPVVAPRAGRGRPAGGPSGVPRAPHPRRRRKPPQ